MLFKTKKKDSFKSSIGEVERKDGKYTVSTSKEDFFNGVSTVILQGEFPNVEPVGKILYVKSCPVEKRKMVHDSLVKTLTEHEEVSAIDIIKKCKDFWKDSVRDIVLSV